MNRHAGQWRAQFGLLAGSALLAAPAHAALYLCVDQQGKKRYQQSPCPELVVKSGIEPVKADALDQKNVMETIQRFDAAVGKRDMRAVAGFLDEDFKMGLYEVLQGAPPRRVDGHTRKTFINSVSRAVNVMSDYKASRSNCKVELQGEAALATCDTRESFVVTSHTGDFASRDRIRVVVSNGQLLIRAIDQEISKSEITTQSIEAGEQPRKRK